MVKNLTTKITEFFNNIGYTVEILLRNSDYPNKGLEYESNINNNQEEYVHLIEKNVHESIELGEIEAEYYVIYRGKKDILLTNKQYSQLCGFRRKNNITICPFYKENCEEGLIEDFQKEGYEVIYKQNPKKI